MCEQISRQEKGRARTHPVGRLSIGVKHPAENDGHTGHNHKYREVVRGMRMRTHHCHALGADDKSITAR